MAEGSSNRSDVMDLLVIGGIRVKWICEFCFAMSAAEVLPATWARVLQCSVCPYCRERVAADGGYEIVKAGAYAEGQDPRD